ncbi:MAG: hypothetical protein JOZ59_06580 [Candidatus Eremiobacteraeota bacterium]|nr:hypothetical protein [Candidatus Eremiobacteraeota bacterium]
MKTASYARLLFGVSAVLFAVLALLWHDADTWQSVHRILRLPLGTVIGDVLMLALIAASIGVQFQRTARVSSIALGVVYLLFSLACIPGIMAAPKTYVEYGSFFELFSLVCGALALYAATCTGSQGLAFGRAARAGLGVCAVSFALAQIFYLHLTAGLVPTWIPFGQMFWTILTTVAFALAALAMLTNVKARLAMQLMTLMIVIFGILIWIPMVVTHPEQHFNWSELALNFMIAGAAWGVASTVDA